MQRLANLFNNKKKTKIFYGNLKPVSPLFTSAVPMFGDTTATGYSETLQTLNGERLPFSPLRGLTVVKRNAVLNGILLGLTLNALR